MQTSHGPRFKEAWFLYIPTGLANPHHRCIQSQRIACILQTAQCVSFSMFYHRVLPPPSNLARPPVAGLRPPNRDTLLENRIIMNENQKIHADSRNPQTAQQRRECTLDEHLSEVEEDVTSPTGYSTRSSARLSRKRNPDQYTEDKTQSSMFRHPSVSVEGSNPKFDDSPSQLCLCQPDPKVPRPRNGKPLFM